MWWVCLGLAVWWAVRDKKALQVKTDTQERTGPKACRVTKVMMGHLGLLAKLVAVAK